MLTLDSEGLRLYHDLEPGVGYAQQITKTLSVAYSDEAKTSLRVLTADWLFVMRQLADLNIVGEVAMRADSHAMVLNFETDANAMQCWIPACDEKGKRDRTHYMAYIPEMTEGFEKDELNPEDSIDEPTEEENQRLRENMIRLKR